MNGKGSVQRPGHEDYAKNYDSIFRKAMEPEHEKVKEVYSEKENEDGVQDQSNGRV